MSAGALAGDPAAFAGLQGNVAVEGCGEFQCDRRAATLNAAQEACVHFGRLLGEHAGPGDFVYFDPPYQPLSPVDFVPTVAVTPVVSNSVTMRVRLELGNVNSPVPPPKFA